MPVESYGLTTLVNVRQMLLKPTADTAQDTLLENLINRASKAILNYTQREFAPVTASVARSFWYRGGSVLDLGPYDLRSLTLFQLDTETATPTTLVAADYRLLPEPSLGGTYQWIELPNFEVVDKPGKPTARKATITGAWGFSAVPADVEHACLVTAAIWMRRDAAAFTTTFSLDEDRLERPEALPSGVKGLLNPWRRRVAA